MNVPLLLAGALVGAAIVVVIWLIVERRRSETLRRQFGPEYDRAVSAAGSRRVAEAELQEREKRVRKLEIRPLSASDRDRFAAAWRDVQARFVDEPGGAVGEADMLVNEVMEARGYPVADFEQRAADISVDHPQVVDHYRVAHRIGGRRGDATIDTEELRQAMVHYRALFSDLLEADSERPADATEPPQPTDPQREPVETRTGRRTP
jgi:hypothetical protein